MTTMINEPSGRGPLPRSLAVTGVCSVLVLCGLLYLLALRYTGEFERVVEVDALLTSTGDGLPTNADVKFRGVIVGRVSTVDVTARGEEQVVTMELKPDLAASIPGDVSARVIPSNIFGLTAIELVGAGRDGSSLAAGATVPEDRSSETVQLQTTFTTLRDVLDHVQPEKLGRVLGTLSAALDPSDRAEGSTIDRLERWLAEIDAAIPDLGALLADFGTATAGLNRSAPELFGVLADSVATTRTLTERRDDIVALLATAAGTLDAVNGVFARNPGAGPDLVVGVDGLFGSLAQDPDAIPFTAANLNVALQRLATTFSWGPGKQMVWTMDVSFTPFQQYTASDCPRYGDLAGPRCGGPSVPTVAPPQQYPDDLRPGRVESAGPESAVPLALRGLGAIAEIVGGQPTAAQLLLLAPALTGGSVTVTDEGQR